MRVKFTTVESFYDPEVIESMKDLFHDNNDPKDVVILG